MSRNASGLRAWALQRVSAIYLGLFLIVLIWHFLTDAPADFQAWRDWVTQGWVSVGLVLFIVSLMLHAWVGIRDVLIDYVHPLGMRIGLLVLFGMGFIGSAYWGLQAIILAHLAD